MHGLKMHGLKSTILAASIFSLGVSGHAYAHAHLKSATPAVESTVAASPTELDLTFSEDLELKFSGIKVTGPDGTAVPLGEAMLMNGNSTLMVPVPGPLKAGAYAVEWHALSTDGHKTSGRYTFTVKQ